MIHLEKINGENIWDILTFPCGKADFCWLSYEPENAVAKSLYASFGFIETGEKDGEELIAVLKL